jgi:hypothetical protein
VRPGVVVDPKTEETAATEERQKAEGRRQKEDTAGAVSSFFILHPSSFIL